MTLKTGKFVNKAAVTAEGGVREEATHELIVGEVKLKMSIEGPNRRYVNRPGEYTISIVNEGDVGANNVSVSYDVPKDVKVDKISDSGLVRDNKITWMLGMVEAKTKRMVTFRLQASKAGEVTHKAVLTSDEQSELRAASRTVFKGVAGLALSIKDIVDPLDVKQEGSYEIVVRNTGTANANEVQIKAIVPKELRITDQKGPSKSKVQGGTVVFEPITLQPKKEVKFIVYVTAQKPGDVRFRVEMTAKELTSGPVAEEESTTIATP